MSSWLGLDGGGSGLRAMAGSDGGEVTFRNAVQKPSNWVTVPREEMMVRFLDVLEGCPKVDHVVACLAGILTDADRADAAQMLADLTGAGHVVVHPDYAAALAAAPDAHMILIAGTGTLAASWHEGRLVRTSGGGPLLGDQGSVYWFCRQVFALMIRHPELAELSHLWPRLGELFEARTPDEILSRFYGVLDRPSRLCRLAPEFLEWARSTRHPANPLPSIPGHLADFLCLHLARFPRIEEEVHVSLVGGLWSIWPEARDLLQAELVARGGPGGPGGNLRTDILNREPVEGALRLAEQLAHDH